MGSAFRNYICFLCLFGVVFGDLPGDGSASDPYQLSTAEQLISIGSNAALLDKHFILTADIDMGAYPLDNSPIAPDTDQSNYGYSYENRFEGTLDGQGHIISNLTITRSGTSYNIGLIGLTKDSPWQVKNLGLQGVDISVGDSSRYVGGIVARGYGGSVSDCYVTGSITGGNSTPYMGGLLALASGTGVSNCYADCTVTNGTGSSSTGGAVGYLTMAGGQLENCYSIGLVASESTSSSIGQLVGNVFNGGGVTDCYYLSGIEPDNLIGTSKAEWELKSIATYTTGGAGWEFNGATRGNQGHWRMRDDLSDYPYLAWEFIDGDFYGDFQIDLLDFVAFSQSWYTYYPGSSDFNWLCDLERNNFIDPNDLRAFCGNWLMTY